MQPRAYPLSIIPWITNHQLPLINYQSSIMNHQLSIISLKSSIIEVYRKFLPWRIRYTANSTHGVGGIPQVPSMMYQVYRRFCSILDMSWKKIAVYLLRLGRNLRYTWCCMEGICGVLDTPWKAFAVHLKVRPWRLMYTANSFHDVIDHSVSLSLCLFREEYLLPPWIFHSEWQCVLVATSFWLWKRWARS